MHQDSYKSGLNFSTNIEISEDRYWVVVTIEDKGRDYSLNEMPERVWQRYRGSHRGSVHIIRILAKNLVLAKMYKDFILVALLNWQATINEEN